jgi:hypothetical protein
VTTDRYPHFVVHRACWEIYAADLDRGPYAITSGGVYLVREYRSPKGGPWTTIYETARTALDVLDAIGPTAPSRAVILHTERVCRQQRGASRDAIVAQVLLDLYHPRRGHRALSEAQYAHATGRTVVEVRTELERLDAQARADREDAWERVKEHVTHCRDPWCKCNARAIFGRGRS